MCISIYILCSLLLVIVRIVKAHIEIYTYIRMKVYISSRTSEHRAALRCGFSARTSGLLREIGVPFETVNVLDEANNPGVREAVKEYGQWPTIPQLYVAGELVGGADIVMEMYQKGELEQMLVLANEGVSSGSESSSAGPAVEYATGTELILWWQCISGNVKLIDDPNRLRLLFKW